MKVFLSWSKDTSRQVAEGLRTLLTDVLQAVEPWVSSTDIGGGQRWPVELAKQLKASRFAVLCLTQESLRAPWLNFEAGAISHAFSDDEARVCPYLVGVAPEDILDSPLSSYQVRIADRDGTLKLVLDLNQGLKEGARKDSDIQRSFDRAWPDFEKKLADARAPAQKASEIFVSAPMTSLPDNNGFTKLRDEVIHAIEHLRQKFGPESVYSAVLRIDNSHEPEPEKIAFRRDMKALENATKLVLFYPTTVPSSCIFEAGYAFALKKPAVYFIKKGVRPPFVMEGAARSEPSLVSIFEYRDGEHLCRIIDQNSELLFPA